MTTPKYATRRDRRNPSFGRRVGAVSAALGAPFMPWQKQVAAVAMELDPREPGAWRYPVVVVSVPRQAGKTALLRAVLIDRMLSYNQHAIMMTAQTGKDARKRWNQIVEALDARKKPAFKVLASQGSEKLEYVKRRSFISPFAPTPKSIHGDSLPLVAIDEAWAFDDVAGQALETAINPTQLTVIDSQLWIVSTKGTTDSAYLNRLIETGRKSVDDPKATVAYFEWSADPELAKLDLYNDDTLGFHPALGHTQNAAKMRTLFAGLSETAWKRSILNLDAEVTTAQAVIPIEIWERLADDHPEPPQSPTDIHLGFDISTDSSAASISYAWKDAEGLHTGILQTQPGWYWIAPRIAQLRDAGYLFITADDAGSNRSVIAELSDRGIPVNRFTPKEYATACQLWLDKARAGELTHDAAPALTDAVAAAATRLLGSTTAFDPVKSRGPIDSLRASVAACSSAASQRGLNLFVV